MILINEKKNKVSGDFTTIKSKINDSKLAKLYGILTNIYKNPKGSIVREYTSNAYDANMEAYNVKTLSYQDCIKKYPWMNPELYDTGLTETEFIELKNNLTKAGKDEPIFVGIDATNSDNFFYVQDFGIGLSRERMENIYFNYLDSTKEANNDEIGGFGIGAKSALSYADAFHIITVYNGVKYHYIMSKDEFNIPQGELLLEEPTDLDNGTLIKVPIYSSDKYSFLGEVVEQLRYFKTVYIKNINFSWHVESDFNNAKLYQTSDWYYKRTGNSDIKRTMSIALGDVNYEINFNTLGIKPIDIPIALRFEIGEIEPVPSREDFIYTDATKNLIISKIKKIIGEWLKDWKEKAITDNFEYFLTHSGGSRHHFSKQLGSTDYISFYIPALDLPFFGFNSMDFQAGVVYKKFVENKVNFNTQYYNVFNSSIELICLASDGKSKSNSFSLSKGHFDLYKIFVLKDPDTKANHIKNRYILEELTKKNDFALIVQKKRDLKWYKTLLNLKNTDRLSWRKKIKLVEEEISTFLASKIEGCYEDIVINPNWLKSYKAGKSYYSPVARTNTGTKYNIYAREYQDYYSAGFLKRDFTEDDLTKFPGIQIYAEHTQRDKLLEYLKIITNNKTFPQSAIRVFTVSPTNYKKLKEDMEITISLEDFEVEGLRTLGRTLLANRIYAKKSDLVHMRNLLKGVDDRYVSLIEDLEKFTLDNLNTRFYISPHVESVMKKTGFLENPYKDKFEQFLQIEQDYPLLPHLYGYNVNIEKISDYLKCKGRRVNLTHYQKREETEVLNP